MTQQARARKLADRIRVVVAEMLGAIDQGFLLRLLESIAAGDAAASVAVFGLRAVMSRNMDLVVAHQENARLAVAYGIDRQDIR